MVFLIENEEEQSSIAAGFEFGRFKAVDVKCCKTVIAAQEQREDRHVFNRVH
jgi:hypothetical protein